MIAAEILRSLIRAQAGVMPPPDLTPGEVAEVWPLVQRHRIGVILAPVLPAGAVTSAMAHDVEVSRARTVQLLLELERILPGLERAGCQPVVLKGAALALAHYREPTDRWFVDLDLLVPTTRVEGACAALASQGYEFLEGRVPTAYYDAHHLHRILVGPGGVVVEVHWALTLPGSVYGHDPDGVRRRAVPMPLGRTSAHVASPEDQVLHAVYQHVADGYLDLRRLFDLVLLEEILDEDGWKRVAQLADEGHMGRALALWLETAAAILGRPVGDDLWFRSPLGGWARRAMANLDVAGGLLDRRAETTVGYVQFLHLMLVYGRWTRVREVGRYLLPDRERVVGAGHVPGPLGGWPQRLRQGVRGLVNLVRIGRRAMWG